MSDLVTATNPDGSNSPVGVDLLGQLGGNHLTEFDPTDHSNRTLQTIATLRQEVTKRGRQPLTKQFLGHDKPWCICRLGAEPPTRVIRRYVNRQDAEDDLRMVNRFVRDGARYVIAFDVVEIQE
jgi:hypothetical protein